LLSKLPGSDVPLPAPPLWLVTGFYIIIVIPLIPFSGAVFRRAIKFTCTAAGIGALVAPMVFGFRAADVSTPKPDELSITILSVGAGQCIVIAPPRGNLILIDCGSGTLRDPLRKCIAPFVRHLGRWTVGRVILSHSDYDHISAAAEVVEAYGVSEVFTSTHFARFANGNAPAEGLLKFIESTDRTVLELVPGNRINIGGGATIDVLWPPRDLNLGSNDSGLVLKLSYAGKTVLLPADIQADAQRLLLESPGQLRADVLIAPHHGSIETTTADFLAAVDPQLIISSNDRTLSGKQMDFESLTQRQQLLRTHRDGSVTLMLARDGSIKTHSFKPKSE
jgi:competence protein ComEC